MEEIEIELYFDYNGLKAAEIHNVKLSHEACRRINDLYFSSHEDLFYEDLISTLMELK